MQRWVLASIGLIVSGILVAACTSSSGGGGGAGTCEQYSGSWDISGSCLAASCDLSQSGCSFTMACDDGSFHNGSVSGTSIQFGSEDSTCAGSVSGNTASGTCGIPGGSCTFYAQREGGGEGGTGGSGGSGGSGGGSSCGEPCPDGCCSLGGNICCKPPYCAGDCAYSACCY